MSRWLSIKRLLRKRDGTQYLYVLGAAEGTMARTIGNLSNGKIKTLSCSPTKANQDNFLDMVSHYIPNLSYPLTIK